MRCPVCRGIVLKLNSQWTCFYCGNLPQREKEGESSDCRWINEDLIKAAQFNLWQNLDGSLDYCHNRGLSELSIAEWNIGYIKNNQSAIPERERWMWGKRLIFPVYDKKGTHAIALGGRIIDSSERAKYVNSRNCGEYDKSKSLYGEWKAKGAKTYLCEGYMDAIAMHSHGYTGAVAALGTALTSHHAQSIKSRSSAVAIAFDADEPGKRATLRAIDLLWRAGFRTEDITIITPSRAKDVDEALRERTPIAEICLSDYLMEQQQYGLLLDSVLHRGGC